MTARTAKGSTLNRGINVKDAPYNALGDGVTDDYDAIQAAIYDAVGPSQDGGNIYFPNGVYLHSQGFDYDGGGGTGAVGVVLEGESPGLSGADAGVIVRYTGALIDAQVSCTGIGFTLCQVINIAFDGASNVQYNFHLDAFVENGQNSMKQWLFDHARMDGALRVNVLHGHDTFDGSVFKRASTAQGFFANFDADANLNEFRNVVFKSTAAQKWSFVDTVQSNAYNLTFINCATASPTVLQNMIKIYGATTTNVRNCNTGKLGGATSDTAFVSTEANDVHISGGATYLEEARVFHRTAGIGTPNNSSVKDVHVNDATDDGASNWLSINDSSSSALILDSCNFQTAAFHRDIVSQGALFATGVDIGSSGVWTLSGQSFKGSINGSPRWRGASVFRAATQSIATGAAGTQLSYDTENFDTDGNQVTSTFTVPFGVTKVKVHGGVTLVASAATSISVAARINGVLLTSPRVRDIKTGDPTTEQPLAVHSPILAVSESDTIDLRAFQDSGGAIDTVANTAWMEVELVEQTIFLP